MTTVVRRARLVIPALIAFLTFVIIILLPRPAGDEVPAPVKASGAYEAMRWYNDQRAYPSGHIPEDWRERALVHVRAQNIAKVSNSTASFSWSSVGPANIGGRTRAIAIDPSNPNVLYSGSVSGGVFKSTNAAASWFPVSDNAANLAISSIVIDPGNSSIVYAATGEGFFNIDALRGAGVLKSTDAGATWTLLTNFANTNPTYSYYYITKLLIRPDNPSILYAAMIGGVWRTTDGGATWAKLNLNSSSVFCTDLVMHPTDPNILYAACGLFSPDGVYKTTNGGTSWSKVATGFPTSGYGRISLAIARDNPNIVFGSLMDQNTYYTHSIQKTINGGASWSAVTIPFDNSSAVQGTHLGGQGWYNNVIVVHPGNALTVFAGGINIFKSTDGGMTWNRISDGYTTGSLYVHVDQHVIVFHPSDLSTMYFGNDGGIFRSTNGGSTFTEHNTNLATVQFYSGAVHPFNNTFYGGTQDNGTLRSGVVPSWSAVFGGDGGKTWVDFNTPTTVFTEYVYLCMQRSTSSGNPGTWTKVMSGIPQSGSGQTAGASERCGFISPFTMDPSNPRVLVAGTSRVYRTTNGGDLWAGISGDLTGDGLGTAGDGLSFISAVEIAPGSSPTIYIGTSGSTASASRLQVTTNTGSTWSNVTKAPLPDRFVTDIAVDENNRDRAVVVYSGYGTGHIFRTINRGTSWTNISGNLPDIPVNTVILDPASTLHIVVGTDLGVFETADGGTTWTRQNAGMANVAVTDLDVRTDGIVFAATHGRGMFRSAGPLGVAIDHPEVPEGLALRQNYPNPFNPSTRISFDIPHTMHVRLVVYDVAGRIVATLVNEELQPGSYGMTFDGGSLASGVYIAHLEAGSFSTSRKMMLVK